MAKWIEDEGYSCCKTARFGEVAVVICPPECGDGLEMAFELHEVGRN